MDATHDDCLPEPSAEELRDEFVGLLLRHPQRFLLLSFQQKALEHAYHLWHRAIYHRELRVGLLLATFLYFSCTIAFSSWSHLQQYGGAANDTSPSDAVQTIQLALEGGVVAVLSMSFGFSFTSCATRRPQTFAAMVLLLATSFVTVRSALLNIDGQGVFSAPVRASPHNCVYRLLTRKQVRGDYATGEALGHSHGGRSGATRLLAGRMQASLSLTYMM
jgi:hypothetical protein